MNINYSKQSINLFQKRINKDVFISYNASHRLNELIRLRVFKPLIEHLNIIEDICCESIDSFIVDRFDGSLGRYVIRRLQYDKNRDFMDRELSFVITARSLRTLGLNRRLQEDIYMYITGMVEALLRLVIEISICICCDNNRKIVTILDLMRAVDSDYEMRALFMQK